MTSILTSLNKTIISGSILTLLFIFITYLQMD